MSEVRTSGHFQSGSVALVRRLTSGSVVLMQRTWELTPLSRCTAPPPRSKPERLRLSERGRPEETRGSWTGAFADQPPPPQEESRALWAAEVSSRAARWRLPASSLTAVDPDHVTPPSFSFSCGPNPPSRGRHAAFWFHVNVF